MEEVFPQLPPGPGFAGIWPITSCMFDPQGHRRSANWERALVEAEVNKRRFCWLEDWEPDIDAGSFERWGW